MIDAEVLSFKSRKKRGRIVYYPTLIRTYWCNVKVQDNVPFDNLSVGDKIAVYCNPNNHKECIINRLGFNSFVSSIVFILMLYFAFYGFEYHSFVF